MALHRKQVTYSEQNSRSARAAHAKGEQQFKTYDTSAIKPKRKPPIGPIIFGIVLAIVVLGGVGYFLKTNSLFDGFMGDQYTLAQEGSEITVTIADGSTVNQMAQTLGDSGLIANARDFKSRVKELGVESNLKPGTYKIKAGTSVDDIITTLEAGPEAQGVTIPEGYTLTQIAQAVDDYTAGRISADDFTAAATDAEAYVEDYPFVEDAYDGSLEGFLFPKTYEVTESDTADTMVRKMLDQFAAETEGLDYSYAEEQGLSPYDVLKLASVIEKEAVAENRATVASVFYNRMAQDPQMKLQSDATVAYVVGEDPTPEDLEVDSPYNTYKVDGLPAGPICSPSLDCLQAACSPEKTDYLYFYFTQNDDGTMEYTFSEEYDEHLDAIAES
ncbi:MAG: endolytic transglycosylase MltG [Eggerthellaceae bacterium]|nr:endolytic transglycosylase MltG [Eggerthellaceae bacterium]